MRDRRVAAHAETAQATAPTVATVVDATNEAIPIWMRIEPSA